METKSISLNNGEASQLYTSAQQLNQAIEGLPKSVGCCTTTVCALTFPQNLTGKTAQNFANAVLSFRFVLGLLYRLIHCALLHA